jgi:hypothetical protein
MEFSSIIKANGNSSQEGGRQMRKRAIMSLTLAVVMICLFVPNVSTAQQKGPSDDMIKANFGKVLKEADKNRDGKLSMSECMTIWKDKQKGGKNCKHWDANSDGVITEDEYVKQVRKTMR